MKIIKTSKFIEAYGPSVDDQPNFIRRDVEGEGSLFGQNGAVPDSEQDVINKWNITKKKKKKLKNNDARKD